MVFITHDLGVVAEIADEIAVMYAGRIVERASAVEIFSTPQHPYTWGLLRSIPRLDSARGEELVPISGRPPSLIQRPSGCHFHPRCAYVRDAHKQIDPQLAPVPSNPAHAVACLLDPGARTSIWQALASGSSPESARKIGEPAGGEELVDAVAAGVAPSESEDRPVAEIGRALAESDLITTDTVLSPVEDTPTTEEALDAGATEETDT